MDKIETLPDSPITGQGPISNYFLERKVDKFLDACRLVRKMPYGYNSDRDDLMILFKENMGTCTTKHAVIATLAEELSLAIYKTIGIYAMSEVIVSGANKIIEEYKLPFIPMVHCFLTHADHRVDLTEGNNNGKNCSIEHFLYTQKVEPNISAKDEYLLYRKVVKNLTITLQELKGIDIKTILHAREEGLKLLKNNIV